jgi:hypothetical protein
MGVNIRPAWDVLYTYGDYGFPVLAHTWDITGRWRIYNGRVQLEIEYRYRRGRKWSWRKFKFIEQPDRVWTKMIDESNWVITEVSEIFDCKDRRVA